MIENQNIQLEKYKNLEKQLKGTMNREKTVESQTSFMDIKKRREALEGDILKKRWYGDDSGDETRQRDVSLLERGLHTLNTPLYGVVGGVEAILGKGSKKGLSNIGANIEEGGTFGDLLRSYNMNNAAAMPLGFAMDLALDPLIWATAGTSALIPRVAYGASKAGVKGAVKGATSGILKRTATVSKIIPKVKSGKLAEKAFKSGLEYDELVGRNIKDILDKGRKYPRLGEVTEELLSRSKIGRDINRTFKMGHRDWFEQNMMDDITKRAKIAEGIEITGKSKQELGEKLLSSVKDDVDFLTNPMKSVGTKDKSAISEVQKILDLGAQAATDSSKLAKVLGKNVDGALSHEFVNDKQFKKVWESYTKGIHETMKNDTGIRWYDKGKNKLTGLQVQNPTTKKWENVYDGFKIGDKKVGQAIMDGYGKWMGVFKIGKVALNPSAYTNAFVGNPTMGYMAGQTMHNKDILRLVRDSWKYVRNKFNKEDQIKFTKGFTDNEKWIETIDQFPGLFKNVFGVDSKLLGTPSQIVNDAVQESSKTLFKKGINITKEELAEAEKIIAQAQKAPKVPGVSKMIKEGESIPSSFYASELYANSGFDKMVKGVDKALANKPDSKLLKGLKWYLEKPMDTYSKIDQAFKIGHAQKMTNIGITEREVLNLKKFIDITSKDIVNLDEAIGKTGLYKLHPLKATEAMQEIYMNYGSMPGIVKVLRDLPLMGAPFASFMYGMTVKTGKAVQHNPAIFNKVNNFLHEFQGGTTPLEREKLNEPYYQYFKRDGMVKLPIFKDNPVYLNLANMIPYYTMNMFQPAERKYSDSFTSNIMSAFDKMPFFKTPEGQVLLDYFIQPTILRESNPVGMFDQPLWPTDASGLEKTGYAARQLAEAPVPGVAAYPGILQGLVAPDTVKYTPSFRGRQLGYAVQGKSSLGIPSKEPALERTVRVISSTFGVPFYRMNLNYGSNKKDNKK